MAAITDDLALAFQQIAGGAVPARRLRLVPVPKERPVPLALEVAEEFAEYERERSDYFYANEADAFADVGHSMLCVDLGRAKLRWRK